MTTQLLIDAALELKRDLLKDAQEIREGFKIISSLYADFLCELKDVFYAEIAESGSSFIDWLANNDEYWSRLSGNEPFSTNLGVQADDFLSRNYSRLENLDMCKSFTVDSRRVGLKIAAMEEKKENLKKIMDEVCLMPNMPDPMAYIARQVEGTESSVTEIVYGRSNKQKDYDCYILGMYYLHASIRYK